MSLYGQQRLNSDPQNIVDPTGFMRVLAPPVEVEGNAFMFDSWKTGEVYLSQGKYAPDITFNYDILNHILMILVDGKEYSLNPVAVDSIRIESEELTVVNPVLFQGFTSDLLLLKIYDSPNLSLYRKTTIDVMKPNYNEILNVGNRNYQIDQDFSYLRFDKSSRRFTKIRSKKKDIKEWPYGKQLVAYVKNRNLDLKSEQDLTKLLEYYEQLNF